MRKVRTKSLPEGHVALPLPIYRRLQALAVDSRRSETEILEMAIRIFATAVSRASFFKLPERTPKPKPRKQRGGIASVGAVATRIVNTKKEDPNL